jgi:hypothetical protein
VRIEFEDGRQRTFNNDLDAQMCCYYFGLRKYWLAEGLLGGPSRARRDAGPRRLAVPAKGARSRRQT